MFMSIYFINLYQIKIYLYHLLPLITSFAYFIWVPNLIISFRLFHLICLYDFTFIEFTLTHKKYAPI